MGHHADNHVRHAVAIHHDLPAQDVRIAAELPLPHRMAEHEDGRGADNVIRRA